MITVYHCRPEQFCPCQKETGAITYQCGIAKPLNQFTNDELLAEIKRRMGS